MRRDGPPGSARIVGVVHKSRGFLLRRSLVGADPAPLALPARDRYALPNLFRPGNARRCEGSGPRPHAHRLPTAHPTTES